MDSFLLWRLTEGRAHATDATNASRTLLFDIHRGQWDGLGLIATAPEAVTLAAAADPAQAVYLVLAFVGLGAPHWDNDAKAVLTGMTRGTTRKELARAALEAMAYQTRDLLDAMQADIGAAWTGASSPVIPVGGGMTASDWDHAIPLGHAGRSGGPAARAGDDGARSGLSGRSIGRPVC